jgi:hypothetical protein
MPSPKLSDDEFIRAFQTVGPVQMCKDFGYSEPSTIYKRRKAIEKRRGIEIYAADTRIQDRGPVERVRHELEIKDGIVLVGSDAHYWPHDVSTAHCAFVQFAETLKPKAVIMNGDIVDGALISRHPPLGWEDAPTVEQEIQTAKIRLAEISSVLSNKTPRIWTLGNHDARFEARLAMIAPEFAKIEGVHLKDHFPDWKPCMTASINHEKSKTGEGHWTVVKHSFKNGIHATHLNAMWSGTTMVTGHLHQGRITPFTNYRGTVWGVDCGVMAEPFGPQFDYAQDNPRNWRSGFAVLTFVDYDLMPPELVMVRNKGEVLFRGEIIKVGLP